MSDTSANGKTILHKGDDLQHVAATPDVCKTPTPGGPVPMPYPNIARSNDLAGGTKSVSIEGYSTAIANSKLRTSTGDEAGTAGGGVISGKIKGTLTWARYSVDVKFEGKGVVRFLDDSLHNGNKNNNFGRNGGKLTYPGRDTDGKKILCDNCGKPVDSEGHVQLLPSAASEKVANSVHGRTTAAVVIEGVKGRFTGVAGDIRHPLNTDTFAALAKNFKTGKKIGLVPEEKQRPPGNCAEQKALYAAFASGKFPIPPGDSVTLSVLREQPGGGRRHIASCHTCQRVLTSMLCQNDPSEKKP